ncbi:MAG: hypothetical protein A2138_09815 [Deltaproteobacteria bacterium RBG_16_71_12]|nr:MAG: hypothetical protein A2138_09815 [Deltaproteobacteria bacterium RBG_16_71_12]
MRATVIMAAIVLGAASCGFDCEVQGAARAFSGCEALQEAYDAEQSRLDPPPDGEVLDELLVCGEAHGCEIEP